jgi:putative ABC transport system permease protein
VFGVAIPMVMITIALATWSTIDGFSQDPARIGLAATLEVSQVPNGPDPVPLISRIGTGYPSVRSDTLLPGGTGTFTALAIGTAQHPYPFHVIRGRAPQAPEEAVAGQGFLDLTLLKIGDLTQVTMDGVYVDVRITGQIVYPDNNGDVLAFGMGALTAAGNPQPPQYWSVVLKPGLSPTQARDDLLRWSGDRQLNVQLVANPADGLGIVRVVIAVSVVLLAIIGLGGLLTATAIGLRDHRHETGVLAAIGLTPRQVTATLVVNAVILTAFGSVVGISAGAAIAPVLIDMQGQASGMGTGIAAPPSWLMASVITASALLVATAAALLLAARRNHNERGFTPRNPEAAPLS